MTAPMQGPTAPWAMDSVADGITPAEERAAAAAGDADYREPLQGFGDQDEEPDPTDPWTAEPYDDLEPEPQGYDDNRWHGPKDAWDYDYHPRDPEPDRGPEQELWDEPGDHR